MLVRFVILATVLVGALPVHAEETVSAPRMDVPSTEWVLTHAQERVAFNRVGMGVLGGWALLNLVGGTVGFFTTTGERRWFWLGNAGWNVVNLALAVGGFLSTGPEWTEGSLVAQSLREGLFMERLLLFNAGLDVGYMAAGAFLWERGRRVDDERLRGFGQALVVQGAFLLVFDLLLFGAHHRHNEALWIAAAPQGPGLTLNGRF